MSSNSCCCQIRPYINITKGCIYYYILLKIKVKQTNKVSLGPCTTRTMFPGRSFGLGPFCCCSSKTLSYQVLFVYNKEYLSADSFHQFIYLFVVTCWCTGSKNRPTRTRSSNLCLSFRPCKPTKPHLRPT